MFKEQDKIRIKCIKDDGTLEDEELGYQVGDIGIVTIAGYAAKFIGMYTVQFDNGKVLLAFEEDMELQ